MVQVPAETNATRPLEELMVQTLSVELEYDFVPVPAEGVDVIVGGAATIVYVEVNDPASMVKALGARVTANEIGGAVARAYVPSAAIEAPIVQVPAATKATRPLAELIVQTLGLELE
jgi:hypothetical protein